ncbi:N-acetylmuramoyl-L-alanine amidase [Paeniclostridium hominis]|uniref:N-acetylmuramoyl-L-alanine amidase n=1 Tax=Paeniclostridium hominis TaxID=2764329 RepID=UPI0022E18D19|nr:N-acetylmuramoyl-L-alanine amidase [Paeniclostridium hominis]
MKIKTIKKSVAALVLSTAFMSTLTVANANNYKVFIDAGHGGRDNGSSYMDRVEDKINFQIANKVEEKLKKLGIDVETSRESDEYVSLRERAKKSNLSGADVFVSIHQNSADDTNAKGLETFYYNESDKNFAQKMQNSLLNYTNGNNRGFKKGNLQVLRDNEIPAVLVECGFISSNDEGHKLTTEEYQNKIANGIVNGITDQLNIDKSIKTKINTNKAISLEDGVSIRSGRGCVFKAIGRLEKGQQVEVIDTKFDWHKIKFDGKYGYVSSVYVK